VARHFGGGSERGAQPYLVAGNDTLVAFSELWHVQDPIFSATRVGRPASLGMFRARLATRKGIPDAASGDDSALEGRLGCGWLESLACAPLTNRSCSVSESSPAAVRLARGACTLQLLARIAYSELPSAHSPMGRAPPPKDEGVSGACQSSGRDGGDIISPAPGRGRAPLYFPETSAKSGSPPVSGPLFPCEPPNGGLGPSGLSLRGVAVGLGSQGRAR
jgi:hypothetical protein